MQEAIQKERNTSKLGVLSTQLKHLLPSADFTLNPKAIPASEARTADLNSLLLRNIPSEGISPRGRVAGSHLQGWELMVFFAGRRKMGQSQQG